MTKRLLSLLAIQLFTIGFAIGQSTSTPSDNTTVLYMANEGFMVASGETKVVFDPLFRNGYGYYQLLPKSMEAALFAGTSPFDGIDAVFVSHYHGDHFSPEDILRLLEAQPHIRLYAPLQAVKALRKIARAENGEVFERVTAVELAYKDAPVSMEMEGLKIEAVRIPHAGWPTGRLDVANISWRVTLNETTTVLHMGDADPNDVHFIGDADYWARGHTHMAFPPYWFFSSSGGDEILRTRIKADHSVGIHVPVKVPANLHGQDLFTRPGETREIPISVNLTAGN
ncbi:MAG: MBL fold metallo-hydrolase [Xanthomonadales bacterium]|nr:MBL fold metallo-hydrolase [Xanthomonadales bacterium]